MTNPTGPYDGGQQPQNPYMPQQDAVPDAANAPTRAIPSPTFGQQPPPPSAQQAPYGGAPQDAYAQQPQNPYGQQPPQNPFGTAQPMPTPSPAFGTQPNPMAFPPAQNKGGFLAKNKAGKIRLMIVGVLVLGGIGFGIYNHFTDPSSAKAGDCVHITGSDANSAKKVSCSDSSANYTVIAKIDGTDDAETACAPYATAHPEEKALYQMGSSKYVLCIDPK